VRFHIPSITTVVVTDAICETLNRALSSVPVCRSSGRRVEDCITIREVVVAVADRYTERIAGRRNHGTV